MYKFVVFAAIVAVASAYGGYGVYGPGPLAVHTRQSVSYIPTASSLPAAPTQVVVEGASPPVHFLTRTFSSPINIQHQHVSSPGSFRATQSVDAPHVRVHTVTRPIIQELREIIAPQRRVFQNVLPVQESVQTQIARQVAAPVAVARVAPLALAPIGFGGIASHGFIR